MKIRIHISCLLLFVSTLSLGQRTSDVEFIPIAEKLTQNSVPCIHQDSKGFLWVGTRNGLNKYDGVNMVSYEPDNRPGSISDGDILAIYEDKNGTLWIGTYSGGLNRYEEDTDSFTTFRHDPNDLGSISGDKINSIYEDLEGIIWVGTEKGGLNKFNSERTQFEHFKKNIADPFSISGNAISEIIEDKEGNLWVSTDGDGLNLFDRNTKRFIHYYHDPEDSKSINSNDIFSMAKGNNGDIWIGSQKGLNRLHYDKGGEFVFDNIEFEADPKGGPFPVVLAVIEDRENRLWIGTENGGLVVLDYLANESTIYIDQPAEDHGLICNSIWSLYEDQRGFIWVGTFNKGLMKVDKDHWKFRHVKRNLFNTNSLVNNTVSCFAEDDKNNMWIGTDGGGIDYWDTTLNSFRNYNTANNSGLQSDHVLSLFIDSKDNLWAGFWNGGVCILKKGESKFKRLNISNNRALLDGNIFSIIEDSKGRMWIAAFREALLMYDPKNGQLAHFEHDEKDPTSISLNLVRSILEDSDRNIWIGTEGGGLNKVVESDDKISFKRFNKSISDSTSLSSDLIVSLFEDSEKNLWVGTSAKLNKYNKQTGVFTSYGKNEGLIDETIYGMLEDDSNNLWMSTNKGMVKFNHQTESFGSYDVLDGLQADEFYKQSCFKKKNGEMLFGGINGFNIFHPDQVKDNTYSPPVYFTDFKLSNKSVEHGNNSILTKEISRSEKIELEYNQNDFSFEFAVLSFSQSSENVYAYQLVNYDEEWQQIGNRRNAFYTNVPPGEYTFQVKGSNNDGKWSDKTASIEIIITPAWYNTYWAYGAYILIGLIVILWGYRIVINRERLQARYKIEHLELSKMHDLDELKSRFFANISHEFRSPLTLILGPLRTLQEGAQSTKVKEQASLMIRNAESLLKLINELLDLSKLESGHMKLETSKDDIVEFLKPMIKSFSALSNKQFISYKIDLPSEAIELYFDKEKLEKIVSNLLSNAFKYTPEFGKVEFVVESDKNNLILTVSDSGIGIPSEEVEYIFNRYYRVNNGKQARNKGTGIGLSLTKELVELHKGKIELSSHEGKGSIFKVSLPLGKKHLKPEEILNESMDYQPELRKLIEGEEALINQSMDDTMNIIEDEMNNLPLVLVIDDHDDIRKYVRQILDSEYRIMEAENGIKGIEIAKNTIPDLIISDVMMPGKDGYEVCKDLKADLKTSHIPVILLTAKASNESAMEGFELGADYYITKPFDPKLVQLRVRNILKTRDQIRGQLLNKDTLHIEPKNVQIASKDQNFLNEAIAIVEKNMSNSDFYVDDLGKEMGLSRMQLYRKLKGLIGQSANEFVRSIRLKRAAQLLNQGSMNISEITYEVGFNDLQYFRDCFKKQFGVNPSDYIGNSSKVL